MILFQIHVQQTNLSDMFQCNYQLIKQFGYVRTGKKYGVSENSVRKWIKQGDSITDITLGSGPRNDLGSTPSRPTNNSVV